MTLISDIFDVAERVYRGDFVPRLADRTHADADFTQVGALCHRHAEFDRPAPRKPCLARPGVAPARAA